MNRRNTFLVAVFMSAAMLPNMVQAMEIRQFDKMVPVCGKLTDHTVS